LAVAVVCTVGLQSAHADIYTWVDESGAINVSNLAPPDGVRVLNVMRTSAPAEAADAAARTAARQAETQALADRVQQLEDAVAVARLQAPPLQYAPIPAPPVVQYIFQPPVVQYVMDESPPASMSCDLSGLNCGLAWAPGFYPASVVVLAPNFRHMRPAPRVRDFGVVPSGPTSLIQPLATPLIQPLVGPQVPSLVPSLRPSDGFRRG
jgi:hypothetical protein